MGEVADRASGEVRDGASARAMRARQTKRLRVVRADRDDFHVVVAVRELIGGRLERSPADVDQHATAGIDQRVEELLGLEAHPRAELDQSGVRANAFGHLVHRSGHDPELGAGRVVLRKLGDRFEQPRAQRIVEVLARKRFWRASKPFARLCLQVTYRSDEGRRCVRAPECSTDQMQSSVQPPSRANRMPLNCQRAPGGKKFR